MLSCFACQKKPNSVSGGLDWHLYLNTNEYLVYQLKTFGAVPIKFTEVTTTKFKESSYLNGTQIDWKFYLQPFLDANLYDSTNAGLYDMHQNFDSITNTVNLSYTPNFSGLAVKNMVITMGAATNEVESIYVDIVKNNFIIQNQTKAFYALGKKIQIIETSKPLFRSAKTTIKTLNFNLPPKAAPSAVILQ